MFPLIFGAQRFASSGGVAVHSGNAAQVVAASVGVLGVGVLGWEESALPVALRGDSIRRRRPNEQQLDSESAGDGGGLRRIRTCLGCGCI